ncbi:hypothetical protein [Thermomonas paludicola]|jgi:hypothetical protein|uniref:hypothetical protein n=1 Tax=Thermomonas paludicola TaxID=2884874 RepID=UPI00211575AF|nr:hypothetical protein [Thermomonas paludicola]
MAWIPVQAILPSVVWRRAIDAEGSRNGLPMAAFDHAAQHHAYSCSLENMSQSGSKPGAMRVLGEEAELQAGRGKFLR